MAQKFRQLQPLSIVYNQKSGFHATHKDDIYEELLRVLSQHGFEIQSFEIGARRILMR